MLLFHEHILCYKGHTATYKLLSHTVYLFQPNGAVCGNNIAPRWYCVSTFVKRTGWKLKLHYFPTVKLTRSRWFAFIAVKRAVKTVQKYRKHNINRVNKTISLSFRTYVNTYTNKKNLNVPHRLVKIYFREGSAFSARPTMHCGRTYWKTSPTNKASFDVSLLAVIVGGG